MPWYLNKSTGVKYDIEEGTFMEEVVQKDPINFELIDGPDDEPIKPEESDGEGDVLDTMEKSELAEMAEKMGIAVRSKDTAASLREKIRNN